MQITKLVAENILKLQAIHITPKSSTIEIKGDNGAGKSSILDAILIGLKGKKFSPPEPVKHGEKKGKIVIDMDGNSAAGIPPFTITSKVTNNKIETIIEPSELLNGETPRQFLDKLLGAISFDPWEFVNQESKKQKAVLLELIGVDVDEIDRREKQIFDNRTIKGRELKAAENRLERLTRYPDITDTEEIKVSELSKKLTDAMEFNAEFVDRVEANEVLKETAIRNKEEIKNLRKRADDLEKLVSQQRENYKVEKAALAEIEPISIQEINQEIESIEDKNAKIRENKKYEEEKNNLTVIQSEYDELEESLASVREEKVTALQSANIPVENLTFSEDGLLYNDIPLSQCSDGEKLMISMRISMALNPTVRILRVKDGSLIGPKNLQILKDLVKDKGYQLFLESVCGREQWEQSGKPGIFIEEGIAESADGIIKNEGVKSKGKKAKKEIKADDDKEFSKAVEMEEEERKLVEEFLSENVLTVTNSDTNTVPISNTDDDDW